MRPDPTFAYNLQQMGRPNPRALQTGEATLDRKLITSTGGNTGGTQKLLLSYFTASATETVTQVRMWSGNTAAATVTLIRWGIYSEAPNGDVALEAAIANDSTLFAATFTSYTRALSAPWAKTAGRRYAFGVLIVATTMPTFYGLIGMQLGETLMPPRENGVVSGQTDLPSTVAAASIAGVNSFAYAALLP